MTRVNVGIDPRELCDQHLIAEYRELPRCMRDYKGKAPEKFCLGTGHVRWCAQFPRSLYYRHLSIRQEMSERGFKSDGIILDFPESPGAWTVDIARNDARPLLIARISERLKTMTPRWTPPGRRPSWWPKTSPATERLHP